ncbi:MAG TPA: cysteine--tRNA ligase [Terriglobales bacterium]|nr:cysteine--tRNA ligase [Terriglobales bacterium]
MPLRLYNTLGNKVEEFAPSDDNLVRMYCCGPTVYDYGHIGNFRTFVAVDVLRRHLLQSGRKLRHVMNITDVDDRIIERSAAQHITVRQYTEKFEQAFFDDMALLAIHKPEVIARATDNIPEMARLIEGLAQKGIAYRADDGSYYFRIARFPGYGKLSRKDLAHIEDGARVDSDRFDKEEIRDFALWKAPKPGEARWQTEIGEGRPGWHIECSAMAMKYLGPSFDLHAGGEDLMFPHHENEIAQSEAFTGQTFARFWFHVRFLLVEGQKMSKSVGNFFTVRDLVLKGHKPSSLRFLLAAAPYRKQLNFTFDGLKSASSSVERLRNFKLRLEAPLPPGRNPAMQQLAQDTQRLMAAALDDDLNAAEFSAAIFEMVRQANTAADSGQLFAEDAPPLLAALAQFDHIFDVMEDRDAAFTARVVEWARRERPDVEISEAALQLAASASVGDGEIEKLVAEHVAARKARNFFRSDAIRNELASRNIVLENMKDGTVRWRRK